MKHDDSVSNPSANPTFEEVLAAGMSRRHVLWGGLAAAGWSLFGGTLSALTARPARAASAGLGFDAIPVSTADAVTVPPCYTARVLYAWGDPVSEGPAFRPDASNSADEQALQAGMHHDAIHFFPLPAGSSDSSHGLLVVNHEYTDDGLLHPGGMDP